MTRKLDKCVLPEQHEQCHMTYDTPYRLARYDFSQMNILKGPARIWRSANHPSLSTTEADPVHQLPFITRLRSNHCDTEAYQPAVPLGRPKFTSQMEKSFDFLSTAKLIGKKIMNVCRYLIYKQAVADYFRHSRRQTRKTTENFCCYSRPRLQGWILRHLKPFFIWWNFHVRHLRRLELSWMMVYSRCI
jgi:hypothetical protein